MITSGMTENDWWNGLDGEEVANNAYGVPHYDAVAVAEFLESHLDFSSGIVLDIGCGPGRLGHLLATRNPDCFLRGIDVSPRMVNMSLFDAPDNWFASPCGGVVLPDIGALNDVYSVTVFQHVQHSIASSYVRQVHSRLLVGGKFIFTYAVGTENTFLSHQATDEIALSWLTDAGYRNVSKLETPASHPAWNWAVGTK